jgi:small redox-active disulfide protein 2
MEEEMEIKVLGPGCKRCHTTMDNVKAALAETGVDARVEHVNDMLRIAEYGVLQTPGVVIDGEVKSAGKIPDKDEIKKWITK